MKVKRHIITEKEYDLVKEACRKNKNKRIDKRLQVIMLRYEGKKDSEIGEKLGYTRKRVSQLCALFKTAGIEEYARLKYGGNHRNMSYEEEKEFLENYKQKAKQGQIIEVSEIRKAYEDKVGHSIGGSQIYLVLARHGWRKIMPRSKHPNKASDEVIEASKKLTLESKN